MVGTVLDFTATRDRRAYADKYVEWIRLARGLSDPTDDSSRHTADCSRLSR